VYLFIIYVCIYLFIYLFIYLLVLAGMIWLKQSPAKAVYNHSQELYFCVKALEFMNCRMPPSYAYSRNSPVADIVASDVMLLNIRIFCDVTLFHWANSFEGSQCLHLQGEVHSTSTAWLWISRHCYHSKRRHLLAQRHSTTSRNISNFRNTAVWTSNLTAIAFLHEPEQRQGTKYNFTRW
jgi:hypothetical protein